MNYFSKFYNKIFDSSLKKGTHIKFIDILKTYKIKNNDRILLTTKHIYNELPIRLANRVTDLNNLPFGLSKNHSINKVREWYLTSCLELFELSEPKNDDEILNFKNKIVNIYNRHSNTLTTITKGLYELKNDNKIINIEEQTMQRFLNRFYTNRTEIRILLEHYIALFDKDNNKDYFGIVNLKCYPYIILDDVINNIQYICDKSNLDITLNDIIELNIDKNLFIPSINIYLYYILFEITKNSVKAVIDKKYIVSNYTPKINISIIDVDNNYVMLIIKDNGIGIKEENLDKIWYYSYSTSNINITEMLEDNDFSVNTPLSGFGYGLPITEIYINFLNSSINNIKIESIYKKGTTLYIYLKKYDEFIGTK
jgi:pyruvate dehydrogenase kinase 2/3/4